MLIGVKLLSLMACHYNLKNEMSVRSNTHTVLERHQNYTIFYLFAILHKQLMVFTSE